MNVRKLYNGYWIVPSIHPKAFDGYYYEHILRVEELIGRRLKSYESVHHIDENKQNNELSNLFLTTRYEHDKAHGGPLVSLARTQKQNHEVQCQWCSRKFYTTRKLATKIRFCSPACFGKIGENKECQQCGVVFTVLGNRKKTTRFCSASCRRYASRRYEGKSEMPEVWGQDRSRSNTHEV